MNVSSWPGGSIPNFLISDDTSRLDKVFPRLETDSPQFAACIKRLASSQQLGMGRRMKDPAHAARLLGPARLRQVAMWQLMFDLLVEQGPEAVGEGICTAAAAMALHRSRSIGRDIVKEFQAATAGFAARMGHWLLLKEEGDNVLGTLLDKIPGDRVEGMQIAVMGKSAKDKRKQKSEEWSLSKSMNAIVNPPLGSSLQTLQEMSIALVANPKPNATTQEARRLAKVLGDCMNLGGDPWLPPPEPSPREILRKFALLKKDLAGTKEALADREIQISALDAQLQGASSEFGRVTGPLIMAEELDRELKRARRHRYDVSALAIGLDTRRIKSSAEDGNRVAALAEIINADNRVEDRVGMLDARRMVIIMPHTKIESARILAERIIFILKEQEELEVPPLLMYISSFAKEGNVTSKKFGIALARGIDTMAMNRQSPMLTWNQSGQTSWR